MGSQTSVFDAPSGVRRVGFVVARASYERRELKDFQRDVLEAGKSG